MADDSFISYSTKDKLRRATRGFALEARRTGGMRAADAGSTPRDILRGWMGEKFVMGGVESPRMT